MTTNPYLHPSTTALPTLQHGADHRPVPPDAPTLPYHRLALLHPRHRWWRPLIQLVTFGVFFLLLAILALVAVEALRLVPALAEPLGRAADLEDVADPWTSGVMLSLVALMLPAALLAQRVCTPPPARRLSSVTGRLRWGLLRRCLGLATLALAPQALLLVITGRDGFFIDQRSLALVLLAVLIIPFQAAAEEYVFRGLLMQQLGAWVRHPAVAILAPVPLFVVGHAYGPFASVSIGAFALAAGWLTWRTGGLEAAIALHVVNNITVMSLGAFGLVDLDATEVTPLVLALELVTMGGFCWLVVRGQGVTRAPASADVTRR